MKILTKEEEDAHYRATVKGGALGGSVGLALGVLGIYGVTRRYPAFRQLTLPLRAFLVTSSTIFGTIIVADHKSREYEASRHPNAGFRDSSARAATAERAEETFSQRALDWGREHRYQIVGGSWLLSMVAALALTGRNPYLSTQQKLVQARVYAQALTLGVLVASAALEIGDQSKGSGRWETVKVLDPADPTHKHLVNKQVHHERYEGEDQWRDMVEAEEQKLQAREDAAHRKEEADRKAGKLKRREHHDDKERKGQQEHKEHKEHKKEAKDAKRDD